MGTYTTQRSTAAIAAALSSSFKTLTDFLFPPFCLICEKASTTSSVVCSSCWNSLPRLAPGNMLLSTTRAKLCVSSVIENVISCYIFEHGGGFQRIAHALKYQGYTSLGFQLGKEIGIALRTANIQADGIIPVPLHPQKQRERGYNQAEVLAQGIATILGIPVEKNLLKRVRYTKSQTTLSAAERQRNMENAFLLSTSPNEHLHFRHLLLVDDVITTGATILSCAAEIKRNSPVSITAVSAAIAQFADALQ